MLCPDDHPVILAPENVRKSAGAEHGVVQRVERAQAHGQVQLIATVLFDGESEQLGGRRVVGAIESIYVLQAEVIGRLGVEVVTGEPWLKVLST